MRLLLFISLMLAMAFAPAVVSAPCSSMGAAMHTGEMAAADEDGMFADDCDMNAKGGNETGESGCAAACALVCPGFYTGIDSSNIETHAFSVMQYVIPSSEFGIALPTHLDPPPPRI